MTSLLNKQRVAVLLGGSSAERDVSLESGNAVAKALSERGYLVTKIDPSEKQFYQTDWNHFDVALIALHGSYGEDGQLQAWLDEKQVRYTGSNAAASRLAFDKALAKKAFLLPSNNIPTPPFIMVHPDDDISEINAKCSELGYPLAIKPNAQGSSIGVSLISSPEELPAALSCSWKFDSTVCLIEKMIIGSEWTLAMIDDEPLPLIQLKTTHSFYDYAAKYQSTETKYLFDFDYPKSITEQITHVGIQAAKVIGTKGIARVDIMLDEQHCPWVLEVNTIPGMTSHSLVPKAAQQAGISFGELCERAVMSALA